MIKKLCTSLILTLSIISFILTPFASAQDTMSEPGKMIAAPDYFPAPAPSTNFLGQSHNYSVTFRGNGEAVVSARIIFSNLEESTKSAMTVRVPKVVPQDVMVYQMVREPQCIRYRSQGIQIPVKPSMIDGVPVTDSMRVPPTMTIEPVCEEYQEQDYSQYWYGGTTYHKADVFLKTDSMEINLPKPVKPNGSGALIVYYRAVGYAKKDMYGAFNYSFESLKVEDRIRSLQVGISTDSDLVLKEAKGNVDYAVNSTMAPAVDMGMAQRQSAEFKSAELDNYTQQIGYGTIVKLSSNLQPLDSYTVTGSYADSSWRFYGKYIVLVAIAALILLIVLIVIGRKIYKSLRNIKPAIGKNSSTQHTQLMAVVETVGISLISSVLIVGYTIFLMFVVSFVRNIVTYQYEFITWIFILIIACAKYLFLLLAPVIFVIRKRGMWRGFITAALTIAWLVVFFCIFIGILFMVRVNPSGPIYGEPYPMMRGAVDSMATPDVMMK